MAQQKKKEVFSYRPPTSRGGMMRSSDEPDENEEKLEEVLRKFIKEELASFLK